MSKNIDFPKFPWRTHYGSDAEFIIASVKYSEDFESALRAFIPEINVKHNSSCSFLCHRGSCPLKKKILENADEKVQESST